MNWEQFLVKGFHEKYGVVINDKPTIPDEETKKLRITLNLEEKDELTEALKANDLVKIADALADRLYVIYGTAVSYGIDLEPIFQEVHNSNMTKEGNLRDDGKILKGKYWIPPDIETELELQKK